MILAGFIVLAVSGATPSELRCAARISEALVGYGPSSSVDPNDREGFVATWLASPDFVNAFAGFINSRYNVVPGERPGDNAVYYAARYVLNRQRPWRDVFAGPFSWYAPNNTEVIEDPSGLGYFTNGSWLRRYAGNDVDGYMIVAAYRVVQNLTGIVLVPSAFEDPEEGNVAGRSQGVCRSCHFDSPYALDKIAKHFPMRKGTGDRIELLPPDGEPVELLDGAVYTDLRAIIERLLDSDDHRFWTCRTVFEFLYGRAEYACEAPVFDACVDAYVASGDIRDAIRAVVLDPSFCGDLQ